jgi:predicted phage baseplate assembly protein
MPATGGADPEQTADARANAPRTVLTLDRVVSLRDYEDFARGFAGIAKALATWTWNRDARGVLLVVAGPAGAAVPEDSDLHRSLVGAIRALGDPQVPLQVKSYRPATFTLEGTLVVDPARAPEQVVADVQAALAAAFSFEARGFGQLVALGEVVAVIHGVAGVEAVDLDVLTRSDQARARRDLLRAAAPPPGANADTVLAAELLTLAAQPIPQLAVKP